MIADHKLDARNTKEARYKGLRSQQKHQGSAIIVALCGCCVNKVLKINNNTLKSYRCSMKARQRCSNITKDSEESLAARGVFNSASAHEHLQNFVLQVKVILVTLARLNTPLLSSILLLVLETLKRSNCNLTSFLRPCLSDHCHCQGAHFVDVQSTMTN